MEEVIEYQPYQAPKPQYRGREWFAFIALRILFPPILLWDGVKWLFNALAGRAVSKLTLPAQDDKDFPAYDNFDPNTVKRTERDNQKLEQFAIKTHDGAILDTTAILDHTQTPKDIDKQKFIIKFCGNGMRYDEWQDEAIQEAKALHCNYILFDYRNVGNSSGPLKHEQQLMIDGIAQVQRLLDLGVQPENILLDGLSLGGAVASFTAHHFHKLGKKVNLLNDRSLSSTTNFILGQVSSQPAGTSGTGDSDTFGIKLLRIVLWPLVRVGTALVGWNMDAASAFKGVDKDNKTHMLVRTGREDRTSQTIDDTVMTHYGALHAKLKGERKHLPKEARREVKFTAPPEEEGHIVSRARLTSRAAPQAGEAPQTAQTYARMFAKRVLKLDEAQPQYQSSIVQQKVQDRQKKK